MASRLDGKFTAEKLARLMGRSDEGKLVVPMFQRGTCWTEEQEHKFIDSMVKGYPVGSMLFYETEEDGRKVYVLIDGLQRCNTLKKYMANPLRYHFSEENIPEEACEELEKALGLEGSSGKIKEILNSYFTSKDTFSSCDPLDAADMILERLYPDASRNLIKATNSLVTKLIGEAESKHEAVSSTELPVIIYNGPDSNLPEIFSRINSQGTVLTEYEVYAASWPRFPKLAVTEKAIRNAVRDKYGAMRSKGFELYTAREDEYGNKLTAFEFLFGLSRYLYTEYELLRFEPEAAYEEEDEVLSLAFELTDAALNTSEQLSCLYKSLENLDADNLVHALCSAIDLVQDALRVVKDFKSNNQGGKQKRFKDKNQILAMTARVFRLLYPEKDLANPKVLSKEEREQIKGFLLENYAHDTITGYWDNGGKKKRFSHAQDGKYLRGFTGREWEGTLDRFFEEELDRKETDKVAAPSVADYVFLNCIYSDTFSSRDQLSQDTFDVEHLAPKKQLSKLLKSCDGRGLAISSVGNLCYLPSDTNRKKHDKTIYQDKGLNIDISIVEQKYSFTEEEDLKWMDEAYAPGDYDKLRENYEGFCRKRYSKLKARFLAFFGKDPSSEPVPAPVQEAPRKRKQAAVRKETVRTATRKEPEAMSEYQEAIEEIERISGKRLQRIRGKCFKSTDGKAGFIIPESKGSPDRNPSYLRFWFSVRKSQIDNMKPYEEQYLIVICKGRCLMRYKLSEFLPFLSNVGPFLDDKGEPAHWDPDFRFYYDGRILLSNCGNITEDASDKVIFWKASRYRDSSTS